MVRRLVGAREVDVQENRSIFVPGVAWLWQSVRRWAPPTPVFAIAALSCKHAPLCLASAMFSLGHSCHHLSRPPPQMLHLPAEFPMLTLEAVVSIIAKVWEVWVIWTM